MRLLNTLTLTLQEYYTERPEYAILSHTWEDGEVTFDDIDKPYARDKPGYQKILRCCQQAVRDGFQWVWIDTCCIDKSSSVEVSEAINSMFTWYWESELCYAYLADVSTSSSLELPFELGRWKKSFRTSRWFDRGWTLQELLAPPSVEFFDLDWKRIGSKLELMKLITVTTQIERSSLRDRSAIHNVSIATKFSWASGRMTKRPEDIAYCLLGLFRVHMPLLYGEGMRSFYRLQLELLKQYEDYTIFAWDPFPGDVYETMGILAPSPRQFRNSADYKLASFTGMDPYEMTNRGLRITLPRIEGSNSLFGLRVYTPARQSMVVELERAGSYTYRRRLGSRLQESSRYSFSDTYSIYIEAETRLKNASALSRLPTMLEVDTIHNEVPGVRLEKAALFRFGLVQSYRNPGELDPIRWFESVNLEIFDNEWIGLNFSIRGIPFTITIGQSQHEIGLHMRYEQPEDLEPQLRQWSFAMQNGSQRLLGHDQSHLFRTQCSFVDSSFQAQVRASKTRTIEHGPRWVVTIEISEPPWGIPWESTTVLEERLHLAGV